MKHQNSKGKYAFCIIGSFLLAVLLIYYLLAFYYRGGFGLNTWINGVYCTGKTVEAVNMELVAVAEPPTITITLQDGRTYEIAMRDADYQADYSIVLEDFLRQQNPFLWIDNISFHKDHTILPIVSYDEKKLKGLWEDLPFVALERKKENLLYISYENSAGYVLYDNIHNRFAAEKAYQRLLEAIQNGETELVITDEMVYDGEMTGEQERTWALWQKVDAFQNTSLKLDMGQEELPLAPAMLARFLQAENGELVVDAEGALLLDKSAISDFVSMLASQYDTVGSERQFKSTLGDVVTVSGGIYGRQLEQAKEVLFLEDYLEEALRRACAGEKMVSQVHEVVYQESGYQKNSQTAGENDIGETYVEVDMTNQMLYYYEEGEMLLETEVVTGNTGRRMGTPAGVNYVYAKQKNRILRGANYASFVKYWMPVNGNIGMHDASWRSSFGGTIYQTSGSHGCVNLPTDKAAELYDMVEIGTPVVMYYRE